MKRTLGIAVLAGTLAMGGAAFAEFADVDADGDGLLSAEEFVAAFPDATEATYLAADTDADGMVSEEEHGAAVDAGILPAE
ncbi:EF-hand domain-containing protein [Algicella marina]|uniref:EF-hand domain-containing protein n=1 Tax=Algicella marina TaxID=2683284 RepID=A0A6P1SXS0_9RHOB|nr:EF-hand domain-containing protein [Algicella marina]QHQ34143.1 EF-hand domain-containing protein [Algicella marina]